MDPPYPIVLLLTNYTNPHQEYNGNPESIERLNDISSTKVNHFDPESNRL